MIHPLVKVAREEGPIVLSAPHGGMRLLETMWEHALVGLGLPDLNTDALAIDIAQSAKTREVSASAVIAEGRRSLLDLNSGEWGTRGISELVDYYWAYQNAIHELVDDAVERHGMAVLLDLHGYDERNHSSLLMSEQQSGPICLGTCGGELIPASLRHRYDFFRQLLAQRCPIYPEKGYQEYTPFIGGSIVRAFMGEARTMAIQMEVPRYYRIDAKRRMELAEAVAEALGHSLWA